MIFIDEYILYIYTYTYLFIFIFLVPSPLLRCCVLLLQYAPVCLCVPGVRVPFSYFENTKNPEVVKLIVKIYTTTKNNIRK